MSSRSKKIVKSKSRRKINRWPRPTQMQMQRPFHPAPDPAPGHRKSRSKSSRRKMVSVKTSLKKNSASPNSWVFNPSPVNIYDSLNTPKQLIRQKELRALGIEIDKARNTISEKEADIRALQMKLGYMHRRHADLMMRSKLRHIRQN